MATGGAGNDTLSGGAGRDDLHGGAGSDRIQGGPGADRVDGEAATTAWSAAPAVTCGPCSCSPGTPARPWSQEQVRAGFDCGDVVIGGPGVDSVDGGDGSDVVVGGASEALTGVPWAASS